MAFFRVQIQFLSILTISVISLIFGGCQGNESTRAAEAQNVGQQVLIPASFTTAKAQLLATQLDSVFRYLHKKKGFNGSVLVTKYNKVLYKGAFGYADFYRKDTLTTQTAFQLASVSKQFTAMAIMMLQEQGKLRYDDSVQQYFPAFPYRGITIRQLLTHRSGLPNYTYFSDKLWPNRKIWLYNSDVVNLMVQHQPKVYYQPNVRFDYSNTGYCLLAAIVSKVSGKPFSEFMQKHIFEPLQMTSTFTFDHNLVDKPGKVATGHTGRRQKRTNDYLDTVLGDKGVYSTVEDLYKWDQALYAGQLVKPATLAEAFTGSRTDKTKKEDYGFGWRIRPLANGDTVVYHAGLWHGFNNYLMRNPKDHSTIIVLSNLPNGSLHHLEQVQQILYANEPAVLMAKGTKAGNPD